MVSHSMLLPLGALCTAAISAAAAVGSSTQKTQPAPGGSPLPDKPEPRKTDGAMPKLTLAPEHAILKKRIGNWDASVTSAMPGTAPTKWIAKAVYKAVGETWVVSDFNGVMHGTPYAGHGVDGYDANKKKFVSTWVDSMGTEMMLMEGTHEAATNSTTMTCECHDKMSGKAVKHRLVTVMKDNDSMTLHMYMAGPDGKEAENMTIEFKRRR